METTLVFGDFVYIALIVIFFGGASGIATSNIKSLSAKFESIEKKIDGLADKQADRTT